MTAFEEMGVIPEISQSITNLGWTLPTEIQADAIPLILGGGDVLMTAETGSGKTAAFCIPLLQVVSESMTNVDKKPTSEVKYCQWDVDCKDDELVTDGYDCSSVGNRWFGCRSTFATRSTGYFEVKIRNDGLCRIGWSTSQAGLCLGLDRFGFGYGSTAKKSNNRQFITYGEEFGVHDVVGSFIDLDSGIIRFTKNGNDFGTAFEIPRNLRSEMFYSAMAIKGCKVTTNFGQDKFLLDFPNRMESVGPTKTSKQSDRSTKSPIAFIIEPSRELAIQTFKQINDLKEHLAHIDCVLLTGGADIERQLKECKFGKNHIVVSTVGRLKEFIDSDSLDTKSCKFVILDEADSLLSGNDAAFITQTFLSQRNSRNHLQIIVCSATLHNPSIRKFADRWTPFATFIDLKGEDSVPDTVHHIVCVVDVDSDQSWRHFSRPIQTDLVHQHDSGVNLSSERSRAVKLLKGEYVVRTINRLKIDKAIIFCRTKLDCDNLHRHFQNISKSSLPYAANYSSLTFHSGQSQRNDNLNSFKNGSVNFLISTDVACRGIHISQLPFVINMTLPDDPPTYLHRIGRTGRTDRMGLAISFVAKHEEKVWYHSNCRGRSNCHNTDLVARGGCCIWYNEMELLRGIEEHLKCSVETIACTPDMTIPVFEFDGKVVYGKKRVGDQNMPHARFGVQPDDLVELESTVQKSFIMINDIISSYSLTK